MKKRFLLILIMALGISVGMATKHGLAFSVKDGVIHWKAQSSWVRGPGNQEGADYFTETLNQLCKGKLVIDKMFASEELVGGFEAIPACSSGKLDLAASSGYYLTGTLPWASLFIGTAANYIDYTDQHLVWMYAGGGRELYQEYIASKYNVVVFPNANFPSEALYSGKPITKKEDFKGIKIRTTGLAMDFYRSLGAVAITMPMSEIMPALQKGVVNAAEFGLPFMDYPIQIHRIAPYALTGILHQPTCLGNAMYINKDSWEALSDDLKKNVEYAVKLTQLWYIYHLGLKNAECWGKMLEEGLNVTKASPELQRWLNEKADQLSKKYATEDPWAKKILDSQKAFLKVYNKYYDHNVWFR